MYTALRQSEDSYSIERETCIEKDIHKLKKPYMRYFSNVAFVFSILLNLLLLFLTGYFIISLDTLRELHPGKAFDVSEYGQDAFTLYKQVDLPICSSP